jgi:outer membrane protein assembly factor BamB
MSGKRRGTVVACGVALALGLLWVALQGGIALPALLPVSVAAPGPAAPPAADWPVFRGNARQTGAAAARLPDKLEVLWTFATKESIEGGAAVAGGVVYVGSCDENLYALDLASGAEKWKYKAGPIKAPPAFADGRVFVGDSDGMFHCVDAAKGTKVWTFETGGEITSGANFAADAVLFASHDETVYCLNREGKERWKYKTEGPVYGALAVIDGRTFVAGCDSQLHVLDLAKGTQLASVDLGGQSGATAALEGNHLYVGTMTNQFEAIDCKKAEVAWTFQPAKRPREFYASAAVTDKYVVTGSRDRHVWALDRKAGTEAWSFATKGNVDASPVVAGDRVYAPSMDGNLYVLELATGKLVQKVVLDSPVAASPAVAGGRLIVGTTKGTLYCLGEKK